MKRQIAFATALAASMAVGAAAQTQTLPPGTTTSGASGGQMVTVTGCVTSPASSAGAAATGMPSFVLSNPTMGSAGSPGAPGMTGAAGLVRRCRRAPAPSTSRDDHSTPADDCVSDHHVADADRRRRCRARPGACRRARPRRRRRRLRPRRAARHRQLRVRRPHRRRACQRPARAGRAAPQAIC